MAAQRALRRLTKIIRYQERRLKIALSKEKPPTMVKAHEIVINNIAYDRLVSAKRERRIMLYCIL